MWVFDEKVPPACETEFIQVVQQAGAKGLEVERLLHQLQVDRFALELARLDGTTDTEPPPIKAELLPEEEQAWKQWWRPYRELLHKQGATRSLAEGIRRTGYNVKYLPGVHLGDNVVPVTDLTAAVDEASLLVFVTPHQFLKNVCSEISEHGRLDREARAISLVKGMEVLEDEPYFDLISSVISDTLNLDCSVLMGANLASEIAQEGFSEVTLGYGNPHNAEIFKQLFHTPYFNVTAVEDIEGVELCGTLKNIVALGAGFCDGLQLGNNTKAAILRIGLQEMRKLARTLFPGVKDETFFQSAGVGDLIATCFGGRNRKCAHEFAVDGGRSSWDDIERRLLNGQKLQGVLTSNEVQAVLRRLNLEKEFPLFSTINAIATGQLPVAQLTKSLAST